MYGGQTFLQHEEPKNLLCAFTTGIISCSFFKDLQNKLVSFPVLIFIYILFFPIGEGRIC